MKERPIIFSVPMVRAIMEDHKTQTRRVIIPQPHPNIVHYDEIKRANIISLRCPYGSPGDRLWIRETWRETGSLQSVYKGIPKDGTREQIVYAADGEWDGPWRPSIFMPHWASRVTLEIINIRVERVQEISEEDALAEGVTVQKGHLWRPLGSKEPMRQYTARQAFGALWDSINAKRGYGWEKNPWVRVIEFKRLKWKVRE